MGAPQPEALGGISPSLALPGAGCVPHPAWGGGDCLGCFPTLSRAWPALSVPTREPTEVACASFLERGGDSTQRGFQSTLDGSQHNSDGLEHNCEAHSLSHLGPNFLASGSFPPGMGGPWSSFRGSYPGNLAPGERRIISLPLWAATRSPCASPTSTACVLCADNLGNLPQDAQPVVGRAQGGCREEGLGLSVLGPSAPSTPHPP